MWRNIPTKSIGRAVIGLVAAHRSGPRFAVASATLAISMALCVAAHAQSSGVNHPATDALGRELPTYEEVGDIRPDKLVAMFYWTWHSGQSSHGRDYDLTEIITTPDMVNDYDHPNWAPYTNSPFFWSEPLFGFYDGKDTWVIRKQLEMLGAAGVDVLFYDATNGNYTWKEGYEAVGQAMAQARADGVDIPQFAFMLNFGPQRTTAEALVQLYDDMYSLGLYEDSWFMWQGKPVVMAYPEALGTAGDTAGMKFAAASPFTGIDAACPSWSNDIGDLTLSLYSWTGDYASSIAQAPLASQTHVDYADNARLSVEFAELPPGDYVWELSAAREVVGVWKFDEETAGIQSYFNGSTVTGDYDARIEASASWSALTTGSDPRAAVQIQPVTVVSYPGGSAGLRFSAASSFTGIDANCPSYSNNIGDLTLSLYSWTTDYAASVAQAPLASQTFVDYADNARLLLEFPALPAGDYVWELSDAREVVGVWKYEQETTGIESYFEGSVTSGDYISRIRIGTWSALTAGSSTVPVQIAPALNEATMALARNFFTFRPGQPTYNTGPSRNDQWGWLENAPQHGYVEKSPGEYEFMTVGVAQNWSEQTHGLSAMNGPQIHGRSYTNARGFDDLTSDSHLYGYNFQEQWDRALAVDPDIVFITGWNEWIAGRYETWIGVENAFPDTFDPEYSRDIEPAKGGSGDNYYYQLIANVRRFKGMDKPERASLAKTVVVDGVFADWLDVAPHFTASRGNALQRDGYGYIDQDSPTGEHLHYTNTTARNDIVGAKVAQNHWSLFFYVAAAANLTNHADPNWMQLLIDADRDKSTGWEGYEWMVDRYAADNTATLSTSAGDWVWTDVGEVDYRVAGAEMEIAIPRGLLGLTRWDLVDLEFKWLDTPNPTGDIMDVYSDGDAAPGGRFNFHYLEYRVNHAAPSLTQLLSEAGRH